MRKYKKVRCVLKCTKANHHPVPEGGDVTFEALWDDKGKEPNSAYNEMYGEATPFARFEAAIHNGAAFNEFEVGRFYFFDIHPADGEVQR